MTQIAGLVLAGGSGVRLGGAFKAGLRFERQTLLSRSLKLLQPSCAHLAISIGRHEAARFSGLSDAALIPDPEGVDTGPLGGLVAAVSWTSSLVPGPEFLLILPVDTPLTPPNLVTRLRDGIGDGPGVIACCGGQPHPTHALWRISALADLPGSVSAGGGPKSLMALHKEFGAAEAEFAPIGGRDPFSSINTVSDLLVARHFVREAA